MRRSAADPVRSWRSQGPLGVLLIGVVVASVLQAVPAQAVPADSTLPSSKAEQVSDDPVPAPSGPAEAASTVPTGPAVPWSATLTPEQSQAAADLKEQTDALTRAAKSGKAVEIESLTTETSISYAQPSGTVEVEAAAGPVRTQKAGAWVPVDTTLEFTGGGVQPAAVSGDITFSDGDVDSAMAVLGDGESVSLALGWSGDLPKPTLDGDTATYTNVLPQVDLVLTATRQGFTQHLVVKQRPAADTLAALSTLEFPLAASGAAVTKVDDGHLLVRKDDEVVGVANAPVMWDARTNSRSGDPAVTVPVGMDLTAPTVAGTDATVVLNPQQAFLTDPATVYPVTIDPTQTLGLLGDTFVQSNIATSPQGGSPELRVGSYNGGGQVNRSLLLFDVGPAIDRVVQSAQLSLFENYSSSCSARWVDIRDADWFDPNTVTWNNQPGIGNIVANANVALGYSSACPANWVNFNLTNWLKTYADERNGRGWQMPLAVTAGNEADSLSWKKFNSANAGKNVPVLTFSYDGWCDQFNGNTVCGVIRDKYYSLGGPDGILGYPTSGDTTVNGGWYNDFQYGSIYFSNATGAHTIRGGLRDKWRSLGAENSVLGYPASDDTAVNGGWYNDFQYGSIYFGISTGRAHTVRGGLRDKWRSLGAENSAIGFPTTDDTATNGGWYNNFERGSVYYGTSVGRAHLVDAGPIRVAWWGKGAETGWLGFPTSDPLRIAGGTRQEFQGGNLVLDDRAGAVVIGAGVLKNPTQFQRVTQARTQLKATTKVRPGGVSYDRVKFQWRPYALTLDGGWADINATEDLQTTSNGTVTPLTGTTSWLPVEDEDGGKASNLYTWNATSTIPTDGLMQVRACVRVAGKAETDTDGVRCTGVTQITVDRAGLTGANATADAGPGTASLLTGAYSVTGRDADVTAPSGGLGATRSFTSNAPTRAGPLGPGWSLSLAVDEAGADYQSLLDRTDSVLITRGDGTQMPFLRKSSAAADANNYVAEGEAGTEGWTLTFDPGSGTTAASYLLTDIDGDKVTFRRADGGTGHLDKGLFRVEKIQAIRGKTAAGANQPPATTTISYTAAGNPQWLLAPTDAGTACTAPAPGLAAGCRALEFTYNGTGTSERLQSVTLRATGAAATGTDLVTGDTPVTTQTITLATYTYSSGRLTRVTDPRIGQAVTYTYRTDGRLATITPVGGTATWTLGYDSRALPRLTSSTLSDASSSLPDQTTSVRYGLALDGSTTGLPSFATSEVARWGQSVTPTDLTAVFDPATVPDSTPTATQWRGATLYALDVNGRTVNTANYGGTINQDTGADQDPTWRISTTEYDPDGRGNVIRSLTPGNRDRALASSTDVNAEAAQAKLLDTVNIYSPDGKDLLRSYEPARWVANAAGAQVSARTRTATSYDTASMHPAIPGDLHLPVTTTVDAVQITSSLPAGSTGTDPALPALDSKARKTVLDYGTDNAWIFGIPTATRVRLGNGEVITRQAFDDQGRTTSSTLPTGGTATTTAAITNTVYYSATNTDPQCKNEAWAGWLCKTKPGGAPSAGAVIPDSWVAGYDVYGNPTRTVETGSGVTRTTDVSYDAAGRARRSVTTGTGTEVGITRPGTETTYTTAGLVEATRLIDPDGTPTGTTDQGTGAISRSYDAYSRLVSYTDGTGLVTTTSYDNIGRVKTVTNDHGSRTVSYDENGERGSLPTSVAVSDVGTFTARYGSDGTLVREDLPGGLTALTKTDAAGDPVALTYTKTNADGTTSQWLRSTATMTGFDQVNSYRLVTAPTAAAATDRTTRYGYDDLGRLVTATDGTTVDANGMPIGATCTRTYAFDANSNRTGLTQAPTAGAPGGTCPSSVPAADSYSYDTADRLQPAGARTSLRYDAFGRTRIMPSADTADQGGDVTIDYYVDDLVAKMTQGLKTTTFGLDAAARRTIRTDTGGSHSAISYYSGDDDNPDIVKETDNSYTRNIATFGGLAAVVTLAGTQGAVVTMQLANLHGDIAATMPLNAADPNDVKVTETTEYGEPRTQPATGATASRYSWLGTHQRDGSTPGGLTLMGVRLYSPSLGRFLSVDSVTGGSANDYEYSYGDPINQLDLDGRAPRWLRSVGKGVAIGAGVLGAVACGASIVCGVAVGAAAGMASYAAANAGTRRFSAKGLARSAAVGGLLGGGYGTAGRVFGHAGKNAKHFGITFNKHRTARGTDFYVRGVRKFGIHSHRIPGMSRAKFVHYHRRGGGPMKSHRPWQGHY